MSELAINSIKEFERCTGQNFVTVQHIEVMGDSFDIAIFSEGGMLFVE
ncbi:MAG: hypothetical protein HQK84_04540 [Nitrospinae bacterium]|nr:hypothetical protein [Nitrospinota bacterium]